MDNYLDEFNFRKYINVGLLASVFSIINLHVFYGVFRFNPLPYFEITEIIVQFIKETLVVLFVALVIDKFIESKLRDKQVLYSAYRFLISPTYKWLLRFFLASIIFSVLFIWGLVFTTGYGLELAIIMTVIVVFFFLLRFSDVKKVSVSESATIEIPEQNSSVSRSISFMEYMVFVVVLFTSSAIYLAKANSALKNNIYENSVIHLKDGRDIKITGKLRIIGKSRGFVFIYDTLTASTKVIPRENVLEEDLHQKSNTTWAFLYPF